MPLQRRSLRKRKLQSDVFSDECDDDAGESLQNEIQNDFTADDVMQHRLQRQSRASVPNRQPKSERQQIALLQRLTTAEARPETLAPSTFGPGASAAKRRGLVKNVNWRNKHGETKLHKLATYGTVEEIDRLIQQGADVNAQDNADWTALHEACLKGLPDAVECLLKAGADVNIAGFSGTTALHDGAFSGCVKVVELLLSHGADASRRDDSFKTPLEVATSDDVKKCLLDHLRKTAKSAHAENHELCESTLPKVCSVDACTDEAGSSFRQCSTLIPPVLENCALGHLDGNSMRKTAANRDGPFTLFGPYIDPPRFLTAAVGLEECHMEPSPSSSSALVVDISREEGCSAWTSLATTPANSTTASASSSALTLSSTSMTALPSYSAISLSGTFEAQRRATESRSGSLMDASDEVFEAGVEGRVYEGRVIVDGVFEAGIFEAGVSDGSEQLLSSGTEREPLGSSCSVNDWAVGHSQAVHPCSVAMYEEISDADDSSSLSGLVETTDALTQELGSRSLCYGANSDELNNNSKDSVVGIPSARTPGALLTGDAVKGNRLAAYDWPFFHSYSQTGFTGSLPAAQVEEPRWKTSNCAVNVRSGMEECQVVQPDLAEFTHRREKQIISVSSRECVAGSKLSCLASRGFCFERSDSGKAQVSSGRSDVPKDSSVALPEMANHLIHGPQDCRCVPDQQDVDVLQKKGVPVGKVRLGDVCHPRHESRHLSGLRCDVRIQRTGGNTREGDEELYHADSALTEVNNNLVNCFHASASSNGFQSAEGVVDGLGQTSDKLKSPNVESVEDQSIALNTFGRDVVVVLHKAPVSARSEMKHFLVQNGTSAAGEESEHSTTSGDHMPVETTMGQRQNNERLFTSGLGNQPVTEGLEIDTGKRSKQEIVFNVRHRGTVQVAGAVPRNDQKECALDWNGSGSTSTVLVDKSTMTTSSDWDLIESVTRERSSDDMSGHFAGHTAAETQTNITGEVSPVTSNMAKNVASEASAFKMRSGEWSANVHSLSLSDQSSGFNKSFASCNGPAGAVIFKSCLQTNRSGTPVSDDLGKLCRTQVRREIGSLPLVASYETTRQAKHDPELVSDTPVAKQDQSLSSNGFTTPKVAYPVLSGPREPLTKVKILSVSDQKSVHPLANYRGELSEDKGKPFGARLKSLTETVSCRKESGGSVPGAAKNLNTRKKNTKSDRVGRLEEYVSGELNSTGSDTDCNRLTGTMRRSAGFGSGVGSGCGLGKVKQSRIPRDSEVLAQVKSNVVRGGCSIDQPLREDVSRLKKHNFVLWHGLCSKTVGSLDSVIGHNDGCKSSSDREKRLPKEFERFLMATREYSLHSPSQEVSAPSGLMELPLRDLFSKQEKERCKLKQEQTMRWERLLLTIEAEVIREYVEQEKRLEKVRPLSSCSVLCQQNYCSRSHENLLETEAERDLKSRLNGLKAKFLVFETELRFQFQNEIMVLHCCQVQEWERMLMSCQPLNPSHLLPELCVSRVSALDCFVSAFFEKLNL